MTGDPRNRTQVRALLHEGKMSKREASRSISVYQERNAPKGAHFTAFIPCACCICHELYWYDTLHQIGHNALACSDCLEKLER